jgi:hypothetical protein
MSEPSLTTDWKARLAKAEDDVWAAIDGMAAELREQIVLPLCRKHRLTFSSGNGVWWFTRIDAKRKAEARRERVTYVEATHWNFHDEDEALKHGLDLGDVWELLEMEPIHACPLGYRVEGIGEEDL